MEANTLGLVRIKLEASLALGEIQLKGNDPDSGRTRLEETGKTARAEGFELIARRANAAQQPVVR
jgi:hypothetical protein